MRQLVLLSRELLKHFWPFAPQFVILTQSAQRSDDGLIQGEATSGRAITIVDQSPRPKAMVKEK